MNWFSRFICRWRTGHDYIVATGPKTLLMRCLSCGNETPGVKFDKQPRHRFDGDPQRHQLRRVQ